MLSFVFGCQPRRGGKQTNRLASIGGRLIEPTLGKAKSAECSGSRYAGGPEGCKRVRQSGCFGTGVQNSGDEGEADGQERKRKSDESSSDGSVA